MLCLLEWLGGSSYITRPCLLTIPMAAEKGRRYGKGRCNTVRKELEMGFWRKICAKINPSVGQLLFP